MKFAAFLLRACVPVRHKKIEHRGGAVRGLWVILAAESERFSARFDWCGGSDRLRHPTAEPIAFLLRHALVADLANYLSEDYTINTFRFDVARMGAE